MILFGMVSVLFIEILFLFGGLYFSQMTDQLNRNACDLLEKQIRTRQTYLENTFTKNNNLEELSDKIDSALLKLMKSGEINLSDLNADNNKCVPLLQAISEDLISTFRQKDVTGIFVVFNTRNLDTIHGEIQLSGIYIRDLDPDATPSYRNTDLLLERSPIQLVQSMFISTDKSWKPSISYRSESPCLFVYPAFQSAFLNGAKLDDNDYGHMTTTSYTLKGDNRPAIAYSIPLILPDGTVYGVLGVETLTSYVQSMLPIDELENNRQGIYFLAYTGAPLSEEKIPIHVVTSSAHDAVTENEILTLTAGRYSDYQLKLDGVNYYAIAQPLTLYNHNAPFSNEHWLLIGAVPVAQLFSFSRQMMMLLMVVFLMTLLIGLFCSLFVSRQLSHPISRLSRELRAAQNYSDKIPVFSPTHIQELELVSSAISKLSQDIVDTSTKFLQIINMASIDLGGYEVRHDTQSVYVTENFFSLLGLPHKDASELTPEGFLAMLREFDATCAHSEAPSGGNIYRIALPNGKIRYLHIKETILENSQVGVAEDETAATLARMKIEYERDYDALTNLFNRRAFRRIYDALFRTPEKLKQAALIMLDLDNLKHINDTFGHDLGDQYIRQVGQCLSESLPSNVLCAHISGDEFAIFLYGYDTREEIHHLVERLKDEIRHNMLHLPDGNSMAISVSGGIAWYPEDATDPSALKKYADFAMYQVKKTIKGYIGEFHADIYEHEIYVAAMRKEFYQMLREERLSYHFQPIVSAVTGEPAAYEALMRVGMPTLYNPELVLQIAREESHLHDIERLTVFKSVEAFKHLKQNGDIRGDELLFINSISSQCLTDEESQTFVEQYSDIQQQIVVEITECENLDLEMLEKKRNFPGFPGVFALDDYGSGYSNDKNLLELSPHYIKLDISIIQNIDSDINKQQIVSYIISYAHQHNIKIIAEGLETADEVLKVLELGADLLQGFYLARPAAVPGAINPDAVTLIQKFRNIAD